MSKILDNVKVWNIYVTYIISGFMEQELNAEMEEKEAGDRDMSSSQRFCVF